jgi:hypothetical protein
LTTVTDDRKDQVAARRRRPQGPRTIKEAFGPASQADMYLLRALAEFHHSGNASDLWKPVAGMLRGSLLEGAQRVGDAKNRRLHFLRGTRLASGESPLSRDRQPLQDVAILVKKRNRLVHAKPQNGIAAWIQDIEDADEDAVGPNAALTAILRVAETMEIYTELRRHPNLHAGIAKTIVRCRQILRKARRDPATDARVVGGRRARGTARRGDREG